MKATVQRW